jgi:serine/threonine protein kinase
VTEPRPERSALGGAELLAGRRLGRYEVLCMLATGGMAGVYAGRAFGIAGFQRLLAIKVLHPHLAHEDDFIAMFLDEARLAARIRHPNVVATHDVNDTQGDGFYLVMDYVEGHHLGALLQQAITDDIVIPAPIAVRMVLDALAGLGAAHDLVDEQGKPLQLVHRDVSPHNIMVGVDGIARLTDFGVAKAEVRLSQTRDGQFKGKIAYMSPEHASGLEVDQRSDIFSAGIVLWEALTGRRLFRGDTAPQILNRVLHQDSPKPSSISADLAPFDPILERALSRRRASRFASADEFAEALEAVALAHGGIATPRQVGELVRKLTLEKLTAEREKIRKAIEDLGSPPALTGTSERPEPRSDSAQKLPDARLASRGDANTGETNSGDSLPFERSEVVVPVDTTRADSPISKAFERPLEVRDTEFAMTGSELARHPTVAAQPVIPQLGLDERPAEPTKPRAFAPPPPAEPANKPSMSRLGKGFAIAMAAAWLGIVATVLFQDFPRESSPPVVTPLPFDPAATPTPSPSPRNEAATPNAPDAPTLSSTTTEADRHDGGSPDAAVAPRPNRTKRAPQEEDDVLGNPYRVR